MKHFMDEDFMLSNETARILYHQYAKPLPIIDYHSHINPQDIAENRSYRNLTEVWLSGDHYKWRAMRLNGVAEELITGDASDQEKFYAWADTLPYCVGNPLYHWTHLELRRYFRCREILNRNTADEIWEYCSEQLKKPEMRAQGLISSSNVTILCTTDDPADDLRWHRHLREERLRVGAEKGFHTRVLPAMRPDHLLKIEMEGFADYAAKLGNASGIHITCMEALYEAMRKRMDYFEELGCRTCDHGLDTVEFSGMAGAKDSGRGGIVSSEKCAEDCLRRALNGQRPSVEEAKQYRAVLLFFLMGEYRKRDWVMQLHFGALRSPNKKALAQLGPDAGFDALNGKNSTAGLAALLNGAEEEGLLPKLILYSLNPADNTQIAALAGSFAEAGVKGRVQQGAAWWFNDHSVGIRQHLKELASLGVLGNFIGMVTDSRSLLSYVRHEYFRRILCDELGRMVEAGEYPWQEELLGEIVSDICYFNVKNYFGFADERSLGLTDERSLGLTDERSLGLTDERSLGLTDERSLGLTDERSLGLTDERYLGFTNERSPVL